MDNDETRTLTGELLEMDDDEIELDELLDIGTEHSVDNEADYLPEGTLGTGEAGEITNVRHTLTANQGQEIEVFTDVKNTGDKTCEFRVYLKNSIGRTIDKEPDVLIKSVAPGATATIKTSTHWDPLWAMPAYDWNLHVELWEIDVFSKDLLDTKHFTVKLGQAKESGIITNVQYPASVKKGQNFTVTATVKNTGTKTAEFRVYLFNPAGKTIDKEPDTYKSVRQGGTADIKISTAGIDNILWKMPGYDWNLRVVLYDIDLLSWKDRLHERSFTVKLAADVPPGPDPGVCDEGEIVGDMICRGGVFVPITPEDECTPEGAYSADGTMICSGGIWVPVGGECSPEGAYSADGTMVCSGGVYVPVGGDPGTGCTPEGSYSADGTMICSGGVYVPIGEDPGVRKYLTVEEANERVRMGLPCYIKFTLPILDMLPGFPYMQGIPILPGFAITEKP